MAQRDALNAGLPSLIRDYRIPPEARHKYNKFSDLKIFLEERFKKFVEHGASQYVAIQEFSLDDLEEMERKGLRRQLPRFRALTDDKDKIMIAKLAGVHHGTVAATFLLFFFFAEECARNNIPVRLWSATGPARQTLLNLVPSGLSKRA